METMKLAVQTLGDGSGCHDGLAGIDCHRWRRLVDGEAFLDRARGAFATYLFPQLKGVVKIQSPALGGLVVLHGAILLAKRARETQTLA